MFFYISRGQGKRGATWPLHAWGAGRGDAAALGLHRRPPVVPRASRTTRHGYLYNFSAKIRVRYAIVEHKHFQISNCDIWHVIFFLLKKKLPIFLSEVFELAGVGLMCASERCDMESPGEETGRTAPPAPHTPAASQPNGSNKIIGRNVNGTSKSRNAINFLMFLYFLLNLK